MPMPIGWKGSDGRSRAEVALWLKLQGGEIHDPTGLIVGRMRVELGKGRALSQLLADMEHDGMIKREVRGRRTLSIKLLDDWGLADDLSRQPTFRPPGADSALSAKPPERQSTDEVDYDELAAVLLERVIKQAHAVPSQGAEISRLTDKVEQLTRERDTAREALAASMSEASEQRQQAETMRANLAAFQAAVDKPKKRGSVPIRELLGPKDRALLERLTVEARTG